MVFTSSKSISLEKFYRSKLPLLLVLIINRSISIRITNPAKRSTFISIYMSDKNFRVIPLMVYPVGVTENFQKSFYIIVNNSSKYDRNLTKFHGDKVQY